MAIETGTHINSLNASNPVSTDGLAQADDHIRLIKATFPNITGAMTATHTVLNGLDARITSLEASLPAPLGTSMLFLQSAAPTGWTKQISHNDKTLRVVSGTASSGGSVAFTTAFASQTPAGSISSSVLGSTASHTLSIAEIPSLNHFMVNNRNVTKRADDDPATGNFLTRSGNVAQNAQYISGRTQGRTLDDAVNYITSSPRAQAMVDAARRDSTCWLNEQNLPGIGLGVSASGNTKNTRRFMDEEIAQTRLERLHP